MPPCIRGADWYPHLMPIEIMRKWFPGFTDDDIRRAAENLDRYLEIAWEIMQEIDATRGT